MQPALRRTARVLLGAITVVLGLVAVAAIVVVVLSDTDWGHERVRRLAVSQLAKMVHGQVTLGRISGNLLNGFTVENVAIRDSAGAPFLAAQELSARYQLSSLIGRRIYLSNVRVVRPLIVLDKQPGRDWNYASIFRSDTTAQSPSGASTYVKLENLTVVEGELIVRSPWSPGESLSRAARDSAVREALGGRSRLMVVTAQHPAPGSAPYQKVVELRAVDARLPLLQLSAPNEKNRIAQVASLRMSALPFRPPAAVVTDLRGTFLFNNDSLWWTNAAVSMPDSKVSGGGAYAISSGDMRLSLHGAPAALADLRWLYPRLPAEGAGTLDFVMTWKGTSQDYLATNADIHTGAARIAGNFGLALTDTFALHDTNLRFSDVDTRLLEQLVPNVTVPRRGILSGRAAVSGGKHAMRVDGDVAFADGRTGTTRVAALGDLGMLAGGGIRATNLRVTLHPLQVELAKGLASAMRTMPVSGSVSGTALVNGTTATQLVATGDITHEDRGAVSRLSGRTAVRTRGGSWLDANVMAHPLSLAEAGRFAPSLGLQGGVSGPIRATGSLRDLAVRADLRLPDGGALRADGRLDLASTTKSYAMTVGMKVVNLRTVLASAPATSLTLTATGRGAGFSPATMRAAFAADVAASQWDSIAVDRGAVRVAIANGVARVDRLHLAGAHTTADVEGSFGLAGGHAGTLRYTVAVDSLGALDRLLPHTVPDTGAVRPRPAVIARAVQRARADSARVARETEVERLATGRALPRLSVDTPAAVPRALRGRLFAAGQISGSLQQFDLRGRLAAESLDVHGSSADMLRSEYSWTNARTPASTMAIGVAGTHVTAMGFAFDSADARLSYHAGGTGRAELVVRQADAREYGVRGDYVYNANEKSLNMRDLLLRFDSTTWQATHPATIAWRPAGIEVGNLELRNDAQGRIYANGLLPTNGQANFELAVDNFQVADVLAILQSDVEMVGLASVHGTVTGTAAAPTFRGSFGFAKGTYRGAVLPELHGTLAYADRRLTTHVDALRNAGAPMARVDASVPVDLAMSGVTGSRLLDRPMTADLVADSLPLELIPQVTDFVSDVHGLAAGRISVRGTTRAPTVAGGLLLARASVKLASTGMMVNDVNGSVRMGGDTIYVDSLAGRARGEVRLQGTIAVRDIRDPAFNLYLQTRGAEVLNNEHGRLRADAGLRFSGPLSKAYLSGQATVTQGVVFAPDATGRHVISSGDPDLFNVVDTALISDRELFPAQSPLLQNMRIEVALGINRGTWVRNKDANIEIFTDYPIDIKVEQSAIALTGAVGTDRGEYNFLSKRFQISRGSATFVGTPDLNPTLQVTGEFQVSAPNAPVLNIQVVIGGTLLKPKLSLESDAQPPRSQSDLLSLLAFGQSTNSLLSTGSSSSLAGVGTSNNLVGAGATLAARRLTGIAVGVLADQVQTDAGRAIGADQFNITPGDVPELSNLAGPTSLTTFLNSTRFEAGKYLNPRTFLGVQQYSGTLGSRLEYRTSTGWRYSAYFQPYLLLRNPELDNQPVHHIPVSYGAFIIREWRF